MNVIISLLFIIWVFSNRKRTNRLYCGLFGWSGSHPSIFNRHAFSILGIDNQDRGRDSCGVYARGEITYGMHNNSAFASFIKNINPIRTGKNCVVMGHTRKASIGAITIDNAQPAAIISEDNKLEFVLTHNGTLENHRELAKKYKISMDGLGTDTQILAALLYYTEAGFNVLGEYHGAAAIAYQWANDDSVYLFKGKSSTNSNSTYETEERPLHIYQESKNSLYYSSEAGGLQVIAKDKSKIRDLPCNILFRVHKGELQEVTPIDRSKCYQRYIPPYSNNKTLNKNYALYDDFNDNYHSGSGYRAGMEWNCVTHSYEYPKKSKAADIFFPPVPIVSETLTHMGISMIVYTKGRFHRGNQLANGKLLVSEWGSVFEKEPAKDMKLFTVYFYEGVLINDEEEYQEILLAKARYATLHALKDCSFGPTHPYVLERTPYPIAEYSTIISPNLTIPIINGEPKLYTMDDATDSKIPFAGKLSPIFCGKSYKIANGLMKESTKMGVIKKLHTNEITHLTYW